MVVNLVWRHKEDNKESLIQIPIRVTKSIDNEHFTGGRLICNEDNGDLEQIYRCVKCGKEYKIGEIKKRRDKETDVIYNVDDKKAFLSMEIDKDIKVEKEIPLHDILDYVEIFNGRHFELYNNDVKAKDIVVKIWRWLKTKNVALLVSFGHNEKQRAGIIIAVENKLILSEFRDIELVRARKQEGIESNTKSDLQQYLKAITEDITPKKYMEFLQVVAEGKKIEIKKEEKKEEVVVADFLEV